MGKLVSQNVLKCFKVRLFSSLELDFIYFSFIAKWLPTSDISLDILLFYRQFWFEKLQILLLALELA